MKLKVTFSLSQILVEVMCDNSVGVGCGVPATNLSSPPHESPYAAAEAPMQVKRMPPTICGDRLPPLELMQRMI